MLVRNELVAIYAFEMKEPSWKLLAEELKARGIDNPHAKSLEARFRALTGSGGLEAEIIAEMAASLRKAEDKILTALLALDVLDQKINDARAQFLDAEVARLSALFNPRRAEAAQYIHELLIHREALGFRNNDALSTIYRLPPKKA